MNNCFSVHQISGKLFPANRFISETLVTKRHTGWYILIGINHRSSNGFNLQGMQFKFQTFCFLRPNEIISLASNEVALFTNAKYKNFKKDVLNIKLTGSPSKSI